MKTVFSKLIDVTSDMQNSILPSEPFTAVFGTSHSYGCCVQGESHFVDDDDLWLNRIGRKVVNFSQPGTDNMSLLQCLQDFIKLPNSKYCDTIICEVRIADRQFVVPADLLLDSTSPDNHWMNQKAFSNNALAETKPWISRSWNMHFFKKFPLAFSHVKPSKLAEIIGTEDKMPNYYSEFNKTRFTSVEPAWTDLLLIRAMKTISELADKKFYWASWDQYKFYDSEEFKFAMQRVNDDSGLFEESCISTAFRGDIGVAETEQCECGHQTGEFHKKVASMVQIHLDKHEGGL